ncbi:uncharacterized protein BDV17DRAFT_290165 [Aspergillus undulatus]|uniref:uncharacterized protein n=1 Tax=Aspergillus undulatus TaxID=1810928 RepID=UPI003CCDA631
MPPTSQRLASLVAFLLDEAHIPNMIFGWTGLTLTGCTFNIREIEFVIPDHLISSATNTLTNAGYSFLCTHPKCPELHVDRDKDRNVNSDPLLQIDRYHSVETAHFHLDDWRYLLSFHKKSEVLWWLDDSDLGLSIDFCGVLAKGEHADLVLSNNATRLPAPWVGLYPVRTLNPHSFTEAVMLLLCRNICHAERLDRMWGSILVALKDEDQNEEKDSSVIRKHVRPLFQPAWDWFNRRSENGDMMGLWKLLELREYLIKNGLLGPWPLPELREFKDG